MEGSCIILDGFVIVLEKLEFLVGVDSRAGSEGLLASVQCSHDRGRVEVTNMQRFIFPVCLHGL